MKGWLYPGAKVVCVDAGHSTGGRYAPILHNGQVYTVQSIEIYDGKVGISLVEIPNLPIPCRPELDCEQWIYLAYRFRPLIDTTQAVSEMKNLMKRAVETRTVDA